MLLRLDIKASHQHHQLCHGRLRCHSHLGALHQFTVNSGSHNNKDSGILLGKQARGHNHTVTHAALRQALLPNTKAAQVILSHSRRCRGRRQEISRDRIMIPPPALGLRTQHTRVHRHGARHLGLLYQI
jgi:hypothetical protein